MNQRRKIIQSETRRYALFGILFGMLFPIGATLIRVATTGFPFNISSMFSVQATDPLLWIIDTAPVFLGYFAGLAGRRQDIVNQRVNELSEREVELRNFQETLQQRLADRNKELEVQTTHLRIAAEITKEATSYNSTSQLIDRVSELVQELFGYYHTAIFLLDNNQEFAVLAASPTEAGKQMIAYGHKIRVGENNIIGRVAATGDPRIVLDTSLDSINLNNQLLPKSRSELALPIKVENKVIGILDVQSDQQQAFHEEEIPTMMVLADHLGIAIERSRLFQQVEANLNELELVYGQTTRKGWKSLAESGLLNNAGYRFDSVRIQPINNTPELGAEAMYSGQTILQQEKGKSKQSLVAIPVKLRGQSVGVIAVKLKEGYSSNTISTIEQAVERLAASLESARLFEEAKSRADREQAIAHVTSAISSVSEFDAILRTTVEEIGRTLGDSEVSIQLADYLE